MILVHKDTNTGIVVVTKFVDYDSSSEFIEENNAFVKSNEELPSEPQESWVLDENTGKLSVDLDKLARIKRDQLPKLSKRQFALELRMHEVSNGVNMYQVMLEYISLDEVAQIEYETVSEIERNNPTVIAMSELLKLTPEEVDQMWESALTR